MKNKKKNKGFTLIELLVTIALIASVATGVTIAAFEMLDRQRKKDADLYIKNIENAACVYYELNDDKTITDVTFEELINEVLIDENTKDELLKLEGIKKTGDTLDCDYVNVTVVDGLKTCYYEGYEEENLK